MNSALFLLNAIAIAVLLAFHFQPDTNAEPVAYSSSSAHHIQQQTPQLAVMNSQAQTAIATQVATEQKAAAPVGPRTQSWVF